MSVPLSLMCIASRGFTALQEEAVILILQIRKLRFKEVE